jgi:hypothetical protein
MQFVINRGSIQMSPTPPGRLEFTDCLGCGKRVSTTAPICRHCNTKRNVVSPITKSPGPRDVASKVDPDEDFNSDSHAALSLGGYGIDDYDEEEGNQKPTSGILTGMQGVWWFVALILLIFFLVSALLPQFW